MVGLAEESVVPERELVAGNELATAGDAAETVNMVHLGAGPHHEVVLAEALTTLGALRAEQPAKPTTLMASFVCTEYLRMLLVCLCV